LSLIAPPNAKRRRTIKKVLVEVKIFPFLDYKITLSLINHILCIFRLEISNLQFQDLPMPHPLVLTFTVLFLEDEHWHLSFNLALAEETMEEQLVDVPVSQQTSQPRVELPVQVEISSSSGTQSPPVQTEAINSPEMSFPIQPESSNPPRVQSPAGHAETSSPVEVNPSPLQPEAPELPATASTPSHLEASALPGTPPSPVVAPEQSPAPAQEIRHEVLICT
jgi:hypothetical protein